MLSVHVSESLFTNDSISTGSPLGITAVEAVRVTDQAFSMEAYCYFPKEHPIFVGTTKNYFDLVEGFVNVGIRPPPYCSMLNPSISLPLSILIIPKEKSINSKIKNAYLHKRRVP